MQNLFYFLNRTLRFHACENVTVHNSEHTNLGNDFIRMQKRTENYGTDKFGSMII